MNEEMFFRLKKIAERLKKGYGAEQVILFGSHIEGKATEHSDTDILIIAPTNERFFERMATVLELTRDIYQGLALSPIVLTSDELRGRLKKGDQFIQDILEKGVVL